MNAARANDALIAERVVEALRPLESLAQTGEGGGERRARFKATSASTDNTDKEFTEALREAGVLLGWMPRSPIFYQLSAAREAYADGLWWRSKARQSKRLTISANNFQPDPLEAMRLNAEQVSAAAASNW